MSYTITLNDPLNGIRNNSSFNLFPLKNLSEMFISKPKPQYTTVEYKPEITLKAKLALSKIESFKFLEDNWDSYGAGSISKISIEKAKQFIRLADNDGLIVYFTAPGRNGDVLVEFRLTERILAEIYFKGDGTNELLIFRDSNCITEGTIEENYNELLKFKNE